MHTASMFDLELSLDKNKVLNKARNAKNAIKREGKPSSATFRDDNDSRVALLFAIQMMRGNAHLLRPWREWQARKKIFLSQSTVKVDSWFSYDTLKDPEAMIRVLTVLPGEEFEDVHCRLESANLHQAEYEAICYTWGNGTRLNPIACNGTRINITRNLKKALHDLRYMDRPRVLWVDAICINQSNISEKESQVKIMGDIYHHAKRTIIYLGMFFPGIKLVFGALCAFHREYQTLMKGGMDLTNVLRSIYPEIAIEGYARKIPLLMALLAVGVLSPMPYFTRMWIVQVSTHSVVVLFTKLSLNISQEVALSQNLVIVYGCQQIEWDIYKEGMVMRSLIILPHYDTLMHTIHDSTVLRLMALRQQARKCPSSPELHLLSLLNYTRTFNSTIVLDKIYGVFGLTTSDVNLVNLRPDYRRTAEEVYISVALGLLATSDNLDILSVPRPDKDGRRDSCLPSWVPDWSHTAYYPRTLVFQKINDQTQYTRQPFSASKSSVYSHRSIDKPSLRCIVVRGCFHESISFLTSAVRPSSNPSDVTVASIATSVSGVRILRQESFLWMVFRHSYDICMHTVKGAYEKLQLYAFFKFYSGRAGKFYPPTGEATMLAYLRTLCSGYLPYEEKVAKSAFKAWLKSTMGIRHDMRNELMEIGIPLPELGSSKVNINSLMGMVLGRRVMRTQNGYIGLAPPGAQKGDQVVLLEGGRVPYLLRKVDDESYKLVGECYVHGIMYGEAFDEERCCDIILV
ncbi:hypothetical protein FE257_010789 [Aspergillus nanangensis]|uniref:Heterokaryon incompatibility domain-containing protein n=1 Tax=Aspergillus nanangensis TaxID=2582783 RepID=A0AAD4CXE5_ASPNN|nr:hypothetical protein FE257_010789 [Aspergillus nanangensis]